MFRITFWNMIHIPTMKWIDVGYENDISYRDEITSVTGVSLAKARNPS